VKGLQDLKHENTIHLIGWLCFTLCSVVYFFDSLENGSIAATIGSILFFVGCCIFMIPLIYRLRGEE
jgi:hypothetical protein